MAEITEPLLPANETAEASTEPEPTLEYDSTTMRKTKPGLKRLILTVSVLFSFVLGIPFIYKSVEIYRSPLPFREIESLSAQIDSKPFLFPCRLQAIFIGFDWESSVSTLESSIVSQMTKLTSQPPQCGTCIPNHTVSVVLDSDSHCLRSRTSPCSPKCGVISAFDFDRGDEGVDEALESVFGGCSDLESGSGGEVYNVVVVNKDVDVRVVVGKYRHAWIVGRVLEAEAVSRAAEIFVKVFVNGGKEESLIHAEFMPVGADGMVVLSFNLLNADPRDWVYDWDFQTVDETLLAPIVEAMRPVANISVESQVLYHMPKSALSYWDDKWDSYIFSPKDLPFFVNSNEWHLDTSIAAGGRSKMLHFVVYVPSAKECPLLLQLPDGEISKTNSFVSPMWGGVIVWNPHTCRKDSESGHAARHAARHTISHQDLQKVFEVFMGQFRQLFGFKSDIVYVGASGTSNLLASERGFTVWELDVLSRMHTCFNLHSCATTLGSLSRLVQSLPRMIIMDEIGKQVKYSLEAANLAQTNASRGVYDVSAVSSRQARSLAENAFFHPSIMSVSYYSFEHCFAVYSPFFLPVSIHVLLAALREWRRYKQENKKYLTWKTQVNKAS